MNITKQIIYTSIFASLMVSCSTVNMPEPADGTQTHPVGDSSWVHLSLREKIGQVICINNVHKHANERTNGSISAFIKKYPVGGFFLANWEMGGQVSRDSLADFYRTTIQTLSEASDYPLLFSEDFEAGLGAQLPGYTNVVAEMGLGAANNPELAAQFGEVLASEARSIGLNWLLHPVADLNYNPYNHITNVRATGDRPDLAIGLLPSQIKAMQSLGVAATAKHFPGDGVDFMNQHFTTAKMTLSVSDWRQKHGAVYKAVIDSGVKVIMPGHITFPAYQQTKHNGEHLPATLSKELITDLLKGQLNFQGVVLSDAVNMAGMAGYYPSQIETEIKCFEAGIDMLLWPSLDLFDSIEVRIRRGTIPMARLDDAVHRVWNLKHQLGLFDPKHQLIEPLDSLDFIRHQAIAQQVSEQSITLISNKNQVIPLDDTVESILVVSIAQGDATDEFLPFVQQLESTGLNVTFRHNLSYFQEGDNLTRISESYDRILFLLKSSPGSPWGSISFQDAEALSLWSANVLPMNQVLSIGFGDPYKNLLYMHRTWGRINAYAADENSQVAAAKVLTGELMAPGISPVTVTEKFLFE